MRRKFKWLGNFMILASIVLLVSLTIGHLKMKHEANRLLDTFETIKVSAADNQVHLDDSKNQTANGKNEFENIEGILTIPQIDLKSPVLSGADAVNLSKALGAVENLDAPGKLDGSYAIAGHQSQVFGAYFNRLHELKAGSTVTYETVNEKMTFEVFEINIVEPDEVDVLNRRQGIALLSLITCYPANSNKYRLVVQAKRID